VPKEKFTCVFTAVGVAEGDRDADNHAGGGHSGHVRITVEAYDWHDALDVLGKKLSSVKDPPLPGESPVGPSVWERVQRGPNYEEARKLALSWLEANDLLVDGPRVESLTALIEGLLDG
jgi:hypothetical protein